MSTELARLSQAGKALERAKDLPEVLQFLDLAEAAKALARTSEQKLTAEEWHLRGQRKAGDMLAASPIGRGNKSTTLVDLGIDAHDSSRWQQVASVDEQTFESYVDYGWEDSDITRAGLLRYAKHGNLTSSESPEYYTPKQYITSVRKVLGGIDLDPASNPEANQIVKAKKFYTIEDDGLEQDWRGRVFLNPPYGRATGPFVLKLVESFQRGVPAAILLISAHTTDTSYFQSLWDYTLCFTDHRLPWYSEGGERTTGATFGSVFVYLGGDLGDFRDEFEQYGAVVRRVS